HRLRIIRRRRLDRATGVLVPGTWRTTGRRTGVRPRCPVFRGRLGTDRQHVAPLQCTRRNTVARHRPHHCRGRCPQHRTGHCPGHPATHRRGHRPHHCPGQRDATGETTRCLTQHSVSPHR